MSTPLPPARLTGPLGIALLVLAWGSTFTAIKVGLEDAPPLVFGGIRSVIGGLVVAAFAWARSGPPDLRRHLAGPRVLGFWNVVAFFALQTLAILALPSGLASVLIYLQPLLVAVLAWRLLGESMGAAKVVGLRRRVRRHRAGEHRRPRRPHQRRRRGYAVAGRAGLGDRDDRVQAQPGQGRPPVGGGDPVRGGGLVLTVIGAVTEGVDIAWTGRFVAALIYASLIGTALAWGLWLGLVASGEASRASAYIFMVPVVAVLLGVLLLDETFRPVQAAGSVLVVAGIYLVNRRPGRS